MLCQCCFVECNIYSDIKFCKWKKKSQQLFLTKYCTVGNILIHCTAVCTYRQQEAILVSQTLNIWIRPNKLGNVTIHTLLKLYLIDSQILCFWLQYGATWRFVLTYAVGHRKTSLLLTLFSSHQNIWFILVSEYTLVLHSASKNKQVIFVLLRLCNSG